MKQMKTGLEPGVDAFEQVPGWDGDKRPAFRHIKYGETRRDTCQDAAQTYATCVQEAMMDGEKQLQYVGDDRAIQGTVCNTFDAILNCGDAYRTACNLPEDTFMEMMKTGLEPAMEALSQVPGWDGDKCPAFRHIKYGEARRDTCQDAAQ